MSGLEGRIAALPPEKRRLLERRLKQEGLTPDRSAAAAAGPPPIPRRDPDDPGPFPLTSGQQRLWFIDRMNPGGRAYNIPFAGRLRGPLDAAVLEGALREVARRHEVLRSRFPAADGRPAQVVDPEPLLHLPVIDLSALPSHRRQAEADRRMAEEPRTPFDLARGPVVRVTLVRLAADEHDLLVTMPHIVTDAWSMAVFFRELPALYEALRRGRRAALPELPVQVADYALWQREQLAGESLAREIDFWRRHLDGVPTVLELPADRPRPPVQSLSGRRTPLGFPPSLAARVRALGERLGATPFMVLLAAFDVLVHRHTGVERFLLASPVVVRQPEVYGLIGFFINTVVLRADMDGDPTFAELLGRVRESCLATLAHQDLPFERLVDALDLPRDPSRPALAQVNFLLQNVHIPQPEFDGISLVSSQQTDTLSARFDMSLNLFEEGDSIDGALEYCTDLFEPATAARMAAHLRRLLTAAVADPGLRVAALPMLSAAERHQLVAEWNDTAMDYPSALPLGEQFERVAAARPGAPALVFEQPDGSASEVSYGELDRAANRLARRLLATGAGPGRGVAVLIERSPDLVVALLAVIKAGGFYLPLDPSHPAERLAFQIGEVRPAVMVTRGAAPPLLPPEARLLDLREQAAEIAGEDDRSPGVRVCPEALAYVMYTSGSTGRPKGIGIPHRGVTRLSFPGERMQFAPGETTLAHATPAFDASTLEIWGTLLTGGRIALLPPVARSVETMAAAFERHRVANVLLTAVLFQLLVDERPRALRNVVRLLCGGDKMSPLAVARALEELPGVLVVNAYGTTEDSCCTTYEVVSAPPPPGSPTPLGRPLANTRTHLLDAALGPVPIGVAGELCAGGDGLAHGYLGRPDLTAERFAPDPFGPPGTRLYRSGDLARQLPDGRIEFLGRGDRQVKVRGFRVEPAEVEAALADHPGVRVAAVEPRNGRLAAWIVPAGEPAPTPEELRAFLATRLPDPMVPSAFALVPDLPFNAHGKVDRAALARLEAQPRPAAPRADGAAPRNPAEAALAEIWQEILGCERVGIHDDFFALGGDSILSIRVVARAAERGLWIEPLQMFERPTIAGLAEVAAAGPRIDAEQGPVVGPVPLTPAQRLFLETDPPAPDHWNLAVMLEAERSLALGPLAGAANHLLAHHDLLRARFVRTGAGWRQEIAPPDPERPAPVALVDLTALPVPRETPALAAAAEEVQGTLDLARGPLVRIVLFRRGGGGEAARPDRLLLAAHHLVADALSLGTLLADLTTAHAALAAGRAPALPPKTTSFRGWAERLAEWGRTAELHRELDFWRQAAAAPAGAVRLPPELAGPPADPARPGAVERAEAVISEAEARALLVEAPAAFPVRPEEILLAALARTLAAATGEPAALVTAEAHGREPLFEDVELSRTVGWFTALHPLLLPAGGGPGEALRAARERLRAVPRRGIGWGVLRHLAGPEAVAALARLPRPGVSFNYLGRVEDAAGGPLRLAGEPPGTLADPRNPRLHAVEVTAWVHGGELRAAWVVGAGPGRRRAAARLAARFLDEARALAAWCLSGEASEGYTTADFPRAKLDQRALDRLLAKVGAGGGGGGR